MPNWNDINPAGVAFNPMGCRDVHKPEKQVAAPQPNYLSRLDLTVTLALLSVAALVAIVAFVSWDSWP